MNGGNVILWSWNHQFIIHLINFVFFCQIKYAFTCWKWYSDSVWIIIFTYVYVVEWLVLCFDMLNKKSIPSCRLLAVPLNLLFPLPSWFKLPDLHLCFAEVQFRLCLISYHISIECCVVLWCRQNVCNLSSSQLQLISSRLVLSFPLISLPSHNPVSFHMRV